jgi:hypothetical protein
VQKEVEQDCLLGVGHGEHGFDLVPIQPRLVCPDNEWKSALFFIAEFSF